MLPLRPTTVLLLASILPRSHAADEKLSFNEHVRPILSQNCFACHGTDAAHRKAGLRLDEPESAYAERKGVRAIVPGNVEASEIWQRIISPHEDEVMPPPDAHKVPLTPVQRDRKSVV